MKSIVTGISLAISLMSTHVKANESVVKTKFIIENPGQTEKLSGVCSDEKCSVLHVELLDHEGRHMYPGYPFYDSCSFDIKNIKAALRSRIKDTAYQPFFMPIDQMIWDEYYQPLYPILTAVTGGGFEVLVGTADLLDVPVEAIKMAVSRGKYRRASKTLKEAIQTGMPVEAKSQKQFEMLEEMLLGDGCPNG